jgi:intracellular septation protein
MNFLFDFLPIALFFIAYKIYGIYVATGIAIAASLTQVAWQWFKHHRVEANQLITLSLVTICGSATFFFHNDIFIKWKPTAIYWVFALAFLINQLWGEGLLVQKMMGGKLKLAAAVWQRVQASWILFFISMGLLNLYVVYHFDTNTWVNFKFFGTALLTVAFVTCQAFYMTGHAKNEDGDQNPVINP